MFMAGLLLLQGAGGAVAQERSSVSLNYKGSGGYSLVERTNLLRYDNGKYTGLTSREVRSFISPAPYPSDLPQNAPEKEERWYDGNFYVLEQTKRAGANAAGGIHDSIPSEFRISENGILTMITDNGFPSYRSFPTFTQEKIFPGAQWQGTAERAVDPLYKGKFTRLSMLVLYTFVGEEIYRDKEVYRLTAEWQTNYGGSNTDPAGDSELLKAGGGHKADILVLKSTCEPILIIDKVDETFFYRDKSQVRFQGTISLFTEFPPAVERERLRPALNRVSAAAEKNNVAVEETSAGLRLSLRNIQFKPDSDELLESEYARLDDIAEILKLAPGSQFLVEGHTARAGDIATEKPLSQKRARKIAEELSKRGVNQSAFLVRGWGGDRPIAGNDTEEGRALNRRVEITILE